MNVQPNSFREFRALAGSRRHSTTTASRAGRPRHHARWTNEPGKGNSHSLDSIPFVLLGGGLGFKTGQAMQFDSVTHNRLWLSIAHAFGHHIPVFGQQQFCEGGPLEVS